MPNSSTPADLVRRSLLYSLAWGMAVATVHLAVGVALLLAGAFSRVSAFLIAAVMVGAVATMHGQHGFFMNWYGNQQGEGFEYHVLAIGLAVALVLNGAGVWSLDALIAGR